MTMSPSPTPIPVHHHSTSSNTMNPLQTLLNIFFSIASLVYGALYHQLISTPPPSPSNPPLPNISGLILISTSPLQTPVLTTINAPVLIASHPFKHPCTHKPHMALSRSCCLAVNTILSDYTFVTVASFWPTAVNTVLADTTDYHANNSGFT